jgi:hypothetical protein
MKAKSRDNIRILSPLSSPDAEDKGESLSSPLYVQISPPINIDPGRGLQKLRRKVLRIVGSPA